MSSHWLPKPPSLNLEVKQSSFMGVTWVRVETVGGTNYVHKKSIWKLRIFIINIFWVESVEVCQCTDVFFKDRKDSEIIPSPFWICSQHLLNVSLCCMMTAGSWYVHVSTQGFVFPTCIPPPWWAKNGKQLRDVFPSVFFLLALIVYLFSVSRLVSAAHACVEWQTAVCRRND